MADMNGIEATPVASTLVELLARNAGAHADRAAVIVEDGICTHAALYEAVQRQAAALAALGIARGDRVVLVAGNRIEVLVLLGAVAWLGAILVPLNLRLAPDEIAGQSADAVPVLAVVDAACAPLWQAAWPDGMPQVRTVDLDAASWPSIAFAGPSNAAAVPRQDAPELGVAMLYTAAVDGRARGALLAQSHLAASARQTGRVWSLGPDDRWLGVLPLFHAAGIGLALALLEAGGACALLPRFDAASAVAAVQRHRLTVCATFAPMLGAILEAADTGTACTALASLRICMGLEPPATLERLALMCPAAGFWSAYGQAEVSSMVCLGLQRERPGAAGRAVAPSQLRVQDAAGQPLAVGVQGEIAVSGPTVFLGYWNAETQGPFTPADPWHRTGDLGRLDEDGWLWFEGRAPHKQLIKTGGENVYPAEVEKALLAHPEVAEAFVFGLPDERWGEAVHAAVALKPGAVATQDDLVDFVAQRLARYKRPQSIAFVPFPIDRTVRDAPSSTR
ncbi:AMP-binding protein [Variovorax paradoxus]|uniref:AMP-binding protein n=1 Tax=Variovorax paradoxus TaxID=34073 RepID=UPI00069B9C63|nr:AMP-binding protein [Variovorax paradoxus]